MEGLSHRFKELFFLYYKVSRDSCVSFNTKDNFEVQTGVRQEIKLN